MAGTPVTLLATQNRTGNLTSSAVNWPKNIQAALLQVPVINFTDPATSIHLWTEVSFDGGTTWQFEAGTINHGGDLDRSGNPVEPSLLIRLSDFETQNGNGRTIRGHLDITGTVDCGLVATINP